MAFFTSHEEKKKKKGNGQANQPPFPNFCTVDFEWIDPQKIQCAINILR
jgi:hypothetical protein